LDLTSIFLLADLSSRLCLGWPQKFLVSPLLKEILIDYLTIEKLSPLTGVMSDGTSTELFKLSDEIRAQRIEKIENTLLWIENNCETKSFAEMLDIQAIHHVGIEKEALLHLTNLAATMFGQTKVVSDEAPNGWMGNYQVVVTTEVFLAEVFPDKFEQEILPLLIEKGYRGLQLNTASIWRAFDSFKKGEDRSLDVVMANLAFDINPINQWPAIGFLFEFGQDKNIENATRDTFVSRVLDSIFDVNANPSEKLFAKQKLCGWIVSFQSNDINFKLWLIKKVFSQVA
jgi:hypothetical protein